MASFTDLDGREWHVSFSIGTLRRMKTSEPYVDLLDAESAGRAIGDVYSRFDMLYCACYSQCLDRKIDSPEAFERCLTRPEVSTFRREQIYADSQAALLEALENFFRETGQLKMLKLIQKTRKTAERMEQAAIAKLDSPEMDAAIEDAVAQSSRIMDQAIADGRKKMNELGSTSGNLPAP